MRDIVDPTLAGELVWSTMTLKPGSFVRSDLSTKYTDLLFSVEVMGGGSAFVYILLEHQSTSDRDMPLRMLGYMVEIWERRRRNHAGALPPIVPVVLAHPSPGWRAPTRLWQLIAPSPSVANGLADRGPAFELLVEDISSWPDRELRAKSLSAFAKLAL